MNCSNPDMYLQFHSYRVGTEGTKIFSRLVPVQSFPFPFISGNPGRPVLTIIGVFLLAQLTFFYDCSLANSPQQTFSHRLSFWLQKPGALSPKLSGCWWLMELSLCEHTPNIPQSRNLFLVLHHQKLMVHINEVLSHPSRWLQITPDTF